VEETNRYYHQYLDTLDKGRSQLPDVTVQEMCLFWAITVQMGHDQRDTVKDYWSTQEHTSQPITETLWNETDSIKYLDIHILVNEPDKTDEN